MENTGTAVSSGVEINYVVNQTSGDERARLLLINGLGSPLVAYDEGFVEILNRRGFTVARFDNRDTGRSSRVPSKEYRLSDMAADAVGVLDSLGWQSATVAGVSMGSMIAQQLAIDEPSKVDGLVAIMSASGQRDSGRPTPEAYRALTAPAPHDREGWIKHRLTTEKIWASPEFWDPVRVEGQAETIYDYGVDVDGTTRQYKALLASGSRDDALKRLTTPTLVIHGSADTLIQPDGGRHVADLVPNSTYVEIEGMGHELPPQLWDRIGDEILSFQTSTVNP